MRSVVSREQKRLSIKFNSLSLRGSLLILSVASLAGCSSTQPAPRVSSLGGGAQVDPRYGVRASPRVVEDGEAVPKGGGNYMVGKPYKIAGQTYVPSEKPFAAVGSASWYGSDFHGRRTANGEIFDRESISAAHPTMPLPSYARVTNLKNTRSIVVRVNDRGPYHGGRVMDVSQRVAEALDFRSAGTARVKVEWIGRANLAGDDDARLLATLRDDGEPASLDGAAPVMTAAKASPLRVARAEQVEQAVAAVEAPIRPAAETEMVAYAAEGANAAAVDATIVAAEAPAEAVSAPVEKVVEKAKLPAAAPLPPIRPASLERADAAVPTPPSR
jgi:rare lipoprotein A